MQGFRYQGGQELGAKLWDVATRLGKNKEVYELRDYFLVLVFYRYLSERMRRHADMILENDGITYQELLNCEQSSDGLSKAVQNESLEELGFYITPEHLFSAMAGRAAAGDYILDDVARVLNSIEASTVGAESHDAFDGLFTNITFHSAELGDDPDSRNALVSSIMIGINDLDFQIDDHGSGLIGEAYEHLIGIFAAQGGASAGRFYTPSSVSTILAKIVTTDKTRLMNVYDGACGSASLLLRVRSELPDISNLYGQEIMRSTNNLARMNMILHGVSYRDFHLVRDDTLEHPRHPDLKADAIVSNPEFSAHWSAQASFLQDPRFSRYGRLAPTNKADWAFVQHMLHHLDISGIMAIVLPHGALYRSGAEADIRRIILDDMDCLDAVIGLPPSLFYGTPIAAAILVFRKDRVSDNVLFINGSLSFEKLKNRNRLRTEDIDAIVAGYRDGKDVDRFSRSVPRSEIRGNDWNLNIPRYVDTRQAETAIDLDAVASEIAGINQAIRETDARIQAFCWELGLKAPL